MGRFGHSADGEYECKGVCCETDTLAQSTQVYGVDRDACRARDGKFSRQSVRRLCCHNTTLLPSYFRHFSHMERLLDFLACQRVRLGDSGLDAVSAHTVTFVALAGSSYTRVRQAMVWREDIKAIQGVAGCLVRQRDTGLPDLGVGFLWRCYGDVERGGVLGGDGYEGPSDREKEGVKSHKE